MGWFDGVRGLCMGMEEGGKGRGGLEGEGEGVIGSGGGGCVVVED